MLTDKEIIEIIKHKIESETKLGDQSGSSGHMGFVSYEIKDFKTRQISSNLLEITYNYSTFVETEFTYYPDNPPREYSFNKTITVNRNKQIVSES